MSANRILVATLALSIASKTEAQRRDSVQMALPGPRTIQGFVADNAERPLDSAEVIIESLKRTAVTGRDGSFRFDDVKPGKYDLRARKIGYYPQTRSLTVGDQGGATAFWLFSRGPVGLPTIITSATRGGLGGIVSDTAGKAIPHATITLIAGGRHTQSDSTGSFFFDLKPGKHMIRVEHAGYAPKLVSVTIPRDSGRTLHFWLAEARGRAARESQAVLELEMRLTRRNPVWSTIYTRDDVDRMAKKSLREIAQAGAGRLVNDTCTAVIDGFVRVPVWALDGADVDLVEVYTQRPARQTQTNIMRVRRSRGPMLVGCPAVFAWLRK